jgi:DNA polymerase (family X)
MENVEIGRRLEEVADLLQAQRANPFRVQAYRRAATTIRHLPWPPSKINNLDLRLFWGLSLD